MTYLLDTHAWIYLHLSPEKLPTKILSAITSKVDPPDLLLSAVSLVEVAMLAEKKRLNLLPDPIRWTTSALAAIPIRVVPVDQEIAIETGRLTGFDHFDPADRMIVATARIENATLITADRTLRRYKDVPTLW